MKKTVYLCLFLLCAQTVCGQIEQSDLDRSLKSRFGVSMIVGHGFQKIELFANYSNDVCSLSTGGGIGGALEYGYSFNRFFDLSGSFAFLYSTLSPKTSSGDANFQRFCLSLTPALIIPIGEADRFKLRLGAGVDVYAFERMEVSNLGDISPLHYNPSLGLHASLNFDYQYNKKNSFSIGVKNENVKYNYSPKVAPPFELMAELKQPDGSGIYINLSYFFHF